MRTIKAGLALAVIGGMMLAHKATKEGEVVAEVNNFRFNESPANLLKNVEAMSAAVSTGNVVVPAIKAADFNFASKSDAV